MRRNVIWIWALLAAAVLVAVASRGAAGPLSGFSLGQPAGESPSPVIFPEQEIPLRFSHVQHLTLPGQEGLFCDFCHEDAPESRSALDNLIPREESCSMCHEIDRQQPNKEVAAGAPPARCDACHPGYVPSIGHVARVKVPTPNIKFSHKAHVDREIACTRCHGDLVAGRVALATRDHLPKMRVCLECHDGKEAPSACTTCHKAAGGGTMQTQFASGVLMPSGVLFGDAHDLSFRTQHAAAAQNNADYCGSCHRKSFCTECHNGTVKPLDFHGNDYVAMHAIDARRDSMRCTACHRTQSFCTGCHSRSGVSADARGSEFDATRRFHPAGWADFGGRGPMHHSFQAQRNIKQCTSCHREQFCVRCHSAEQGTLRINPHPPGWATSRRCRALAARNGRMCLRCHVTMAEASCF